jgi:hypothetical protein
MATRYHLGFWRRLVNRLIRGLLQVGISPPHTYLLTVRGRKAGTQFSTPVRLVEEHGQRWLVAPYGDVGWVKNARVAKRVSLSRGWKSEDVRLAELSPLDAAPVLKTYISQVPITRPFFVTTPDSAIEDFVREAANHPVFRITENDNVPR